MINWEILQASLLKRLKRSTTSWFNTFKITQTPNTLQLVKITLQLRFSQESLKESTKLETNPLMAITLGFKVTPYFSKNKEAPLKL